MIYRRNLFSPRRFHESTVKFEDAPEPLPTAGAGPVDQPVCAAASTEAILDSFAYLLSPGAVTVRKLQEIFYKVRSPEVRLCLRAHGQMPQLLQALQKVEDDPMLRLLRLGCWHCLSLDAFNAAELLETSCESLMAVDEAPRKMTTGQVPPPVEAASSGTLKRRRVQASAGHVLQWEEVHGPVVASVKQEEPRFVQLLEAGEAERSIALLILMRCLRNLHTELPQRLAKKLWSWFPGRMLQGRGTEVSSELTWEVLELLARKAPSSGDEGSAVEAILEAARHCLSNVAESACLRALHALVTFGAESWSNVLFPNDMLKLLVARCHNLDLPGSESSSAQRTVLAMLGNLAARSPGVCEELSAIRLGRPFPLALAKSLAWYKDQLSDESQTMEVEVHLNYAMASLLLAWLARGSAVARRHLEEALGSTEALLDILRTFTIFQDRCGILTDGSLLCVHSVMQFLSDGADEPADSKRQDQDDQDPEVEDERKLRDMTPVQKATLLQMELTPLATKPSARHLEVTPAGKTTQPMARTQPAGEAKEQGSLGLLEQSFSPVMQVYQRRRSKQGED